MGYEELDYAKVISFILTKAQTSSNGIEGIDLNGITIKEHLLNTAKAAYLENINPIVMICQQILETSIYAFKYNGTDESGNTKVIQSVVVPGDNNYAGLGATSRGDEKNGFPSNEIGQLAQAQHLKAYGSEEPLNSEMVDIRFEYVKRGSATTVDKLSETWASNPNYGVSIARIYTELMNHQTNVGLVKEYANFIFSGAESK